MDDHTNIPAEEVVEETAAPMAEGEEAAEMPAEHKEEEMAA